jgi:AraC-like DNA-binding protein
MPESSQPAGVREVAIRLKADLLYRLGQKALKEWPAELERFAEDLIGLGVRDKVMVLRLLTDLGEEMRQLPEITGWPPDQRQYRLSVFWKSMRSPESAADLIRASARELANWVTTAQRRIRPSSHVERMKTFIGDHYSERLTLDVVAHATGRQKQYLATLFHREAGLTVHDYLRHVRVRRAWDLIRQGEKIEAVALLVGYRSKKNFYRQFKAISGVTPGELLHAPHASTGGRGRNRTEE